MSATRVASSGGVTLALHDLGGEGPVLLLAHATGFHGRVWEPCASHLRDYHAFAPDLRGHGDATVPEGMTFAWSGFGDDVLAVVDVLRDRFGADRLLAAGHSKGGAALLLAEERRPGTFASLYLYEPIVFPPFDGTMPLENPLASGARRRRPVFASYAAAYENFSAKLPFSTLDPAALRAYVDHGFALQPDDTIRLKCEPEVEAQVYEMGGRHDAFAHLAEVRCPVVVAAGAAFPGTPATFAPVIVEQLPHGRLESHPDLGHFGPLEQPATIAAAIRAAFT